MITFNSIDEVKKLVVNGVLKVDDDIEINFDGFDIHADIICNNIYSKGKPRNITAWNISFYAVCVAYTNITCKTIEGRHKNAKIIILNKNIVIDIGTTKIKV